MRLFVIFWTFSFVSIYKSDTLMSTTARQYQHMTYVPVKSLLSQYNMLSIKRCIAQCARLISTCNIVVFNSITSPNCLLYSESFTITNLISSVRSTVINFGRNISNEGCLPTGGITALSLYNLITSGDLTTVSGVEGCTIVCGSLVSSISVDFAKAVNTSTFSPTSYSLEINRQFSSGNPVQLIAGSLAIGTNLSHTITVINNMSYTLDGRTVLLQQGNRGSTIHIDLNITNKCTGITNDIQALSYQLTTLTNVSGNNLTIPVSVAGPLTFFVNKLDANGMAVFNMDGNTAFNNPLVQQIQVLVDPSIMNDVQLIIINLSGTGITFSQGNFGGTWLSSRSLGQPRTIWNFYQATSISTTRAWMGALLAPYAAVSASSTIQGTTVVQSLNTNALVGNPTINMPSCV